MKWNSKGFIALEALTGFLLFGVMLSLYLPAMTAAYQQVRDFDQASQHWRLFALMVEGWRRQEVAWLDATLEAHPEVVAFHCQPEGCQIEFVGGERDEIRLDN